MAQGTAPSGMQAHITTLFLTSQPRKGPLINFPQGDKNLTFSNTNQLQRLPIISPSQTEPGKPDEKGVLKGH